MKYLAILAAFVTTSYGAISFVSPAQVTNIVGAVGLRSVNSIQEMLDLTTPPNYVHVKGYYSGNALGGGFFYWNADSIASTNRGDVFMPTSAPATGRYIRLYNGVPTVHDFGAKGDGLTNDRDSFYDAMQQYDNVRVPDGTYYINSALTVPNTATLVFEPGAKLLPGVGITVTYNGKVSAGDQEIFSIKTHTNSIVTMANAQPHPAVLVRWWGATGDGITDDTWAIKSAITYSPGNSALTIPDGTYLVKESLTIGSRIVNGTGTIKEYDTNFILSPIITVNGEADLQDFTVEGAETSATWVPGASGATAIGRAAIKVTYEGVKIRNLKIKNKSTGIRVEAADLTIDGCTFQGWAAATESQINYNSAINVAANNCTITRNEIWYWGQAVLQGSSTDHISIIGNNFHDLQDNGVYLSSAEYANIIGNQVKNVPNGSGIKARGNLNKVVGNTVRICNVGIALTPFASIASSGAEYDYSTLVGTNFNGRGGVIANNTIEETTAHGILVDKTTTTGSDSVFARGFVIEGNTLNNVGTTTGYHGIVVYGDQHTVAENIVNTWSSGASSYGLIWSNAGGTYKFKRGIITKNKFYNTNAVTAAILVAGLTDSLIEGNIAYSTGTDSLIVQDNVNNKYMNNILSGNFKLSGTASDDLFIANNEAGSITFTTPPTNSRIINTPSSSLKTFFNNVELMNLNQSGVGIGSSGAAASALVPLDVRRDTNGLVQSTFRNNTSGTGAGAAIQFASDSASGYIGTFSDAYTGNSRFADKMGWNLNSTAAGGFFYFPTSGQDLRLYMGGGTETTKFDSTGIVLSSIGKRLHFSESLNGVMGVATLSGGTATVNTTAVNANSRIFLTIQFPDGAVGSPYVSAIVAGTSFTITSTSATDVSQVAWLIIDPAP